MENIKFDELIDLCKKVKYTRRAKKRTKIVGDIGSSASFGYLNIVMRANGFTASTRHQWDLYKSLIEWGNKYLPSDFKFNNIYINKNTKAKKHIDSQNVGVGYFCYIGDCSGGELDIYDKEDENKVVHSVKKGELYGFNGAEQYHETRDFEGERYSIIFYKFLNPFRRGDSPGQSR